MSLWDSIHGNLDNLNKAFAKFDANPYFSHAVDWLGDFLMGRHFLKKEMSADGKIVRTINHQWFRREAPHIFAESHLDETILREITYSKHLKVGERVRLFDNWGPDPTVLDPNPALGEVGSNQWNDIRLSLVSELFQDPEACEFPLGGGEREQKIIDICATLTEIAQVGNVYKLRRFVSLNYCKPRETDYRVVKFERSRRVVFNTMKAFVVYFVNWLNDPGTTGFLEIAKQAAAGINVCTPVVRGALDNTALALNAHANRVRPKGFWGWLIK